MVDFIAAGFDLLGLHIIGNKRRFGFIINMIADLVWIYVGISSRLYGLVVIASVALGLNMRNFLKWEIK